MTQTTTHETTKMKERMIGSYKIGETLGEGSFAKVKLGTHEKTGERVALKVLHHHYRITPKDSQFVKHGDVASDLKLQREIIIQMKLNHIHIAKLFEVIQVAGDVTCLIMELVEGKDLISLLDDFPDRALPEKEALRIFRQITSAIHYLHEHGVVHRDIKLENVMLSHDGTCKLIDFGFASHWSMSQALKTPCGSTIYAAPEILLRQAYRGPKTDVWGLGVLLYCMVSGKIPWAGETAREQLYNTVHGVWSEIDGVSDALSDLIHGCLLPDQKSRYGIYDILESEWMRVERRKVGVKRRLSGTIKNIVKRIVA
ncbi:hypothetical protein PROFUN_07382 [Planoprotostelium fungivorum]|uniref:non-specific serine/threonine protein kinase n=1 Tax=Planoprotostelium fungivorum TaxID=1890364 RepID=A0A2P6MTF3_9EUKA|nr:hypothetical protein PROFUN_07382 [Planoprotostelium fungivorum]